MRSILDRLADLGPDKWAVHFRARELMRQGVPVIELTIGEPDVPPPPELIDVAVASMRAGRTHYSNGRGEANVLAAIARKYSERTGRVIGADQALYFPGTQSALIAVMLGLAEGGEEVLVGDPLYASYAPVVASCGATLVHVPLSPERGFHMSAEDLERRVTPRSRVVLLNSPHNPTGAVLTAPEIAAIGEVCKRHDLWIVSDEVYEAHVFSGGFASPFDNAALADRTVVVSSLSKSHAFHGFRAGWCVGPAAFTRRLLPLSEAMLFGGQQFIADAAAEALSHDFDTTRMMRESYLRRATLVSDALARVPGLACPMPEGGMFVMLNLRALGMSGEDFAERLLDEERVAALPGEAFGPEGAGLLRISLTSPDENLAEGCVRIAKLAGRIVGERTRKDEAVTIAAARDAQLHGP
jgi:arginine:pyruvate transaminase